MVKKPAICKRDRSGSLAKGGFPNWLGKKTTLGQLQRISPTLQRADLKVGALEGFALIFNKGKGVGIKTEAIESDWLIFL